MNELRNMQKSTIQNVMQGTNHTHTVTVDYREVYENFVGNITFKYPSLLDNLRIGTLKASLTGGANLDTMTDNIAYVISVFDVVITSKPDWFDVNSPYISYEMLMDVYDKYQEWVSTFRLPSKQDSTNTK